MPGRTFRSVFFSVSLLHSPLNFYILSALVTVILLFYFCLMFPSCPTAPARRPCPTASASPPSSARTRRPLFTTPPGCSSSRSGSGPASPPSSRPPKSSPQSVPFNLDLTLNFTPSFYLQFFLLSPSLAFLSHVLTLTPSFFGKVTALFSTSTMWCDEYLFSELHICLHPVNSTVMLTSPTK